MKILFITDLYPIKTGEKNSVRTLHNFVFAWIKQGNKVDVIRPNFIFNSFVRGKSYHSDGFYDYEGVKIYNVNYFTPFLFDLTKKIPESFDFKNYDVIIAHMPSGIIFANKVSKKADKNTIYPPMVCGVHCSDIEVLTNPLYGFYFKKEMLEAYKNAQKIACRSFVLRKKFSELLLELASKTFVAASGVDVPSQQFTTHNSRLTLLTCANLIKRKNIDKLIQAVNDSDFKLTVIGDGKELKNLKKMGSSNVKFLGRLPHKEVLEEMKNADIFILPSVNETFGMVYLEAMASGCITVCTKDDGIDGIIKDSENGFLTEPSVEGIKETLNKIKNFENIDKIFENSLLTINDYTLDTCAMHYIENIKTGTSKI